MNKKGSVLTTVLLLAGLLILLALPVLQVANAGYKTSVDEQVRTQAFYLAEAGIEHGRAAALATLRELATRSAWDPKSIIGSTPFAVVSPNPPLGTGTYEAKAWLSHLYDNEYEVLIKSIGIAQSVNRLAQSVSTHFPVTITPGHGGDAVVDMVLFSSNGFVLQGSSEIKGSVVSNTTAPHSIKVTGGSIINGDLTVGAGADPASVVDLPRGATFGSVVKGQVGTLLAPREYPQVKMPAVPGDLPARAALCAGWNPKPPYRIDADGYYPEIMVKSTLYIDVGAGERRIRVGKLDISGDGKLYLVGTGKLLLYVDNDINVANSGSFNANGSPERAVVYYYGGNDFSLTGNGIFRGSIIAETANVNIKGSGKMSGHIVTGGTAVNITGDGATDMSLVYAPNAIVQITGSANVAGAVISDHCSITGNGFIKYDGAVTDVYEQLVGGSKGTVIPGPGIWSPR